MVSLKSVKKKPKRNTNSTCFLTEPPSVIVLICIIFLGLRQWWECTRQWATRTFTSYRGTKSSWFIQGIGISYRRRKLQNIGISENSNKFNIVHPYLLVICTTGTVQNRGLWYIFCPLGGVESLGTTTVTLLHTFLLASQLLLCSDAILSVSISVFQRAGTQPLIFRPFTLISGN